MGRTLTVARAMVPAACEREYTGLLAELEAVVRRRGARFWAFRSRSDPGAFLEFLEADGASAGARPHEEIALERRLRALATYGPDAEQVWDEFTLR